MAVVLPVSFSLSSIHPHPFFIENRAGGNGYERAEGGLQEAAFNVFF
jgi:hypothetical protein